MRWTGLLLSVFFLVGCVVAGEGGEVTAVPLESLTIDEATGLPVNPPVVVDGSFILEGEVIAVTLVPQDKPLFKIRTPAGINFQVNAQAVPDIFFVDGTALTAQDFRTGITARATVFQGDAVGLGGEPVLTSHDLTILALVE